MAITISLANQPELSELHLAYRPLVYKFSSDDVDIVSCVVEILADDVRVSARSVQPDINTANEFTIDISSEAVKHVESTLSTLGGNGIITDANAVNNFRIKIYEVTQPASVLVTNYDPSNANNVSYDAITTQIVVSNWTETHLDYNSYVLTDFLFNDSITDSKFLSESTLVKEIELDQNEFLGFCYYTPVSTKDFEIEVLTYDSSGALLNTDLIPLTTWVTSWTNLIDIEDQIYYYVGVGTQNLINEGVSLTNVSYYTVQLVNSVNNISELRRYNIVTSCPDDVRLHWFNKYGKQDSMTFKGNSSESVSMSTTSYEKALPNTYSSENRGTATIQNIISNEFTVYSKSIGRDSYQFATSILNNNMAYVEIDGSYFPIQIIDTAVVKADRDNMPIQFSLTYRFANRDKGLRG
jgi:hypothetical protein